jgi:preprotein translocase subunit YajC
MLFSHILLQATNSGGSNYSFLIMMGAMFVVFYFFMIRPQQKKQQDQKKFREALKKGDTVVTIGGLHGKIVSVDGETVTLDVDRGVKLTFEKTSISQDASKRVTPPQSTSTPAQT